MSFFEFRFSNLVFRISFFKSRFRFLSCYGDYEAVYLDEVHRKLLNDPIAAKWVDEIAPHFRYGNVTFNDIKFIQDYFATTEDMKIDKEWLLKFILHGYHYYCANHPSRANVQSENATAVCNLSREHNKPILHLIMTHLISAIHLNP